LQSREALLKKYDPVQVGYLSEQCIAVDEDDNIVGGVAKGDAHRADTCTFLFPFSFFLQGNHPLFTNVELNGGPGAVAAAVRKVEHELGVVDLSPEECRVMGRFLYKAVMKDSLWGEHELDYVVITRDLSLSRLTPNPSEVSDVRLVDEQELARWVATEPSSFSPWFLLFYRLRYLSEWWSKLDRIESYPVDMNIVRMN
ncbi:putative isopentenyl-diphosphate delta-isomerase, partial [Cooperia oncophora]